MLTAMASFLLRVCSKIATRVRKGILMLVGRVCSLNKLQSLLNAPSLVVSVDLFDTLVYRQHLKPEDVFREQFCRINRDVPLSMTEEGWVNYRKKIESDLARRLYPGEVTLSKIYDEIAVTLQLSAESRQLLELSEMSCERECIFGNVGLIEILKDRADSGTQIFITTDTYLPRKFLECCLQDILTFDYDILCSSETNKTKREGAAFTLLRERAGCSGLVHIGDNLHADLWKARENGVLGYQVYLIRQCWIERHRADIEYLNSCGVRRILTPHDRLGASDPSFASAEVAWQHAAILTDFVHDLRAYAHDVEADEIWFLSRDCETIFKACTEVNNFFNRGELRYVSASRSSTHSVLAVIDPELFLKWMGRPSTEVDAKRGRAALTYYKGLPSSMTKRILIVDMGGRGRLQASIQAALPNIEVFGFYFSLELGAEEGTKVKSQTFLPWNPALFNLPAIEWLAGFREPSCDHFAIENSVVKQVYRAVDGDRAPPEYVAFLNAFLSFNLLHARHLLDKNKRNCCRVRAVRNLCMYPSRNVAKCFSGHSIGSVAEGGDVSDLVSGGKASFMSRLLGRDVSGNFWPSLGMWSISSNPYLIFLLQAQLYIRILLKKAIKKLLGIKQK